MVHYLTIVWYYTNYSVLEYPQWYGTFGIFELVPSCVKRLSKIKKICFPFNFNKVITIYNKIFSC